MASIMDTQYNSPAKLKEADEKEEFPANPGRWSNWLSSEEYQREFERQKTLGNYGAEIEGRCHEGQVQYRAQFSPLPAGWASWYCHHGITKDKFDERNKELTSKGLKLISVQSFKDPVGTERYQATWLRMKE